MGYRRFTYTKEQREFIDSNAMGHFCSELAELVNQRFGTTYTEKQMKTYCCNHGVHTGKRGVWKPDTKHKPRSMTEAQVQWCLDNCKGITRHQLWEKFCEEFSSSINFRTFSNVCRRNGCVSGLTGQFYKGMPAWFGKGTRPDLERKAGRCKEEYEVGHEKYIYIWRDGKYIPKARAIWEDNVGPVAEDEFIMFINQDNHDFRLENLMKVNRRYIGQINRMRLTEDPELNKLIVNIATLAIDAKRLKDGKGS